MIFIFVPMITLNETAINLIKKDRLLFIALQSALKVSERTMYNYINGNSEELTKLSCINALVEFTNQSLSDFIDGGKLSKLLAK